MTIKKNLIKEFANMSTKATDAFPGADYVLAFKMPDTDMGEPEISVYAKKGMKIPSTDFRGMSSTQPGMQLLPAKDEMLEVISADSSVQYCTNIPRWRWLSIVLSASPQQ